MMHFRSLFVAGALALTFGFSQWALAASQERDFKDPCLKSKSTTSSILQCLNEYAEAQLQTGSPAEKYYQQKLARILSKYTVKTNILPKQSLAEAFNIFVDESSQYSGADQTKKCYDFEVIHPSRWDQNVALLKKQIDQAALFLAEIHARALGRQVSLLFPIKEVSICNPRLVGERTTSFQQRTYFIGINSGVSKPISQGELLARWASGQPIRRTDVGMMSDLPFIGRNHRHFKQVKMDGDPGAVIRDKIADKWFILDPTGPARTTALYTIAEGISALREFSDEGPISSTEKYHRLRQTMSSGPGFSESDQKQLDMWSNSPEAMDALYGLWQMRLADPGQIVRVLESAIIQSAKDKGKLHLVLRKINALVGVANDKNITVRIEAMLSSSLPIQRFQDNSIPETEGNKKSIEYTRTSFSPLAAAFGTGGLESETLKVEGYDLSDTHLNADEATGAVIFDGIDDVTVEFEIPNIDIPTFKRVTLWEAMQQVRVPIEDRLRTLPRP